MRVLEVTDSEYDMVIARRREQEAALLERGLRLKVLTVAAQYEAWLQEHARGTSFSAFVNEFGYEDDDCSQVYARVAKILAAADPA